MLLAPAAASAATGGGAGITVFYYPWYGTPGADGAYEHWQQRDHAPPQTIASNYWPARGLYSSSNRVVLGAQMTEIRRTGVDAVAVSWWGRGSPEDARLPAVIAAARAQGLGVEIHLEPYARRSVESTEADIAYLRGFGVTTFYLYRPFDLPPADWAPMNDALVGTGVRVLAQTGLVGQAIAGHFAGVYTYDIVTWSGVTFARICREAHAAHLLCVPSVGPGYDARQGSGDERVKPRRDGATYDSMWRAAIAAGADGITITSYNEWHEGTQIEPAADRRGYDTYDGSWGLRGRRAATAYLDRTAYWVRLWRSRTPLQSGTTP